MLQGKEKIVSTVIGILLGAAGVFAGLSVDTVKAQICGAPQPVVAAQAK